MIQHKIARFLQVPVMFLDQVPEHYILEAKAIIDGELGARPHMANRSKAMAMIDVTKLLEM